MDSPLLQDPVVLFNSKGEEVPVRRSVLVEKSIRPTAAFWDLWHIEGNKPRLRAAGLQPIQPTGKPWEVGPWKRVG